MKPACPMENCPVKPLIRLSETASVIAMPDKHDDATEVGIDHPALKDEIQTVEDGDHDQSDDEITQVAGHRESKDQNTGCRIRMIERKLVDSVFSSFRSASDHPCSQTFSCATEPRRPEGRKSSIRISMANATASL